jgi:DNA polymerase III subunit delta
MAVVRAAAFEAFLRRLDERVRVVLFHGSDAAGARGLARLTVQKIAGSTDDPFGVIKLDEAAVSSDPGRLADEVGSLSMFGGNRVVWVTGSDSKLAKAIEPLLAAASAGNVVVIEAGNLTKGSPLRNLIEKAEHGISVAVYEPSAEDMQGLVRSTLATAGFKIDEAALALLVGGLGRDRGVASQELDKLVLYCAGQEAISLDDVRAVCSGAGDEEVDSFVDAVFAGEVDEVDRLLGELLASGVESGRLAASLLSNASRLADFKVAMLRGQSAENVVRAARPAVFFGRMPGVVSQLRAWELHALLQCGRTFAEAVFRTRNEPSLAFAIVGRAALSVARNARLSRSSSR